MPGHDHPAFTWLYQRLVKLEDAGAVGRARDTVSATLHGRTLIVGLGPGEDLHHLPDTVSEVVAVEPSASMRRAAEPQVAAAVAQGLSVEVIDAVAEDLPLADNSVDSVLFAYVLCSVDDPEAAVAEALRVLRPGGVIGVIEHVAGPPNSWLLRMQNVLAPGWRRLAAGCRVNQNTRAILESAGIDCSGLEDVTLVNVPPVSAALVGTVTVGDVGGQ
jgi:ubiquinone/menaquinone biosynthesis C-methylase UbiE